MRILIKADFVYKEKAKLLKDKYIEIEDERIVRVADNKSDFRPEFIIKGKAGKLLVVPGLMNSHVHTDETLFMNIIPDSMGHVEWFNEWTLPYYKAMHESDFYWSTMLSFMLMLERGITCYADSANIYPEISAKAALDSGIRGFVAKWTSDIGEDFSMSTEKCIKENERILKKFAGNKNIKAVASVLGINRSTNRLYMAIKELADRYGTVVTSHEASGIEDVKECVKRTGKRPVENLYSIGFLSERTLLSHLTVLTKKEAEIIKATRTANVLCPAAELKKGKGYTRYGKLPFLIKKGARMLVGTDTCNSSNHLDVLKGSKLALLLAKDLARDPKIASVHDALGWVTSDAYSFFGIKNAGKLRNHCVADIAVFELKFGFNSTGVLNELFFSDTARCVATIVSGKPVYIDGSFLNFDQNKVIAECEKRAEAILGRLSR